MKIQNECIPCLVRQAYEVAELLTSDKALQQDILRFTLNRLSQSDFQETAPQLAMEIHQQVCRLTDNPDPYLPYKKQFNKIATQLVDTLKLQEKIEQAASPFDMACRLAIAGNIIDFGLGMALDQAKVEESIQQCLQVELFGMSGEALESRVASAKNIMVIADNAGEIVFDKLLVGQMPRERVTYVVKGAPIVNDATMEDAQAVGMTRLVKVIDNGNGAQGTILELASVPFLQAYRTADLILAKGQANFETLSDLQDPRIVYLLKAKCRSVAAALGCRQGDFVIWQHG